MPAPHAYLDGRFVALAHRGGWVAAADLNRENSVFAYRRAVELGFRHLEVDVHATRDGELVIFHDEVLDRVTDGAGQVADHTWAELSELRIGGVDPIPRLADVLDEFGSVGLNIDIKSGPAVAPLADVLRRHSAGSRVCVASFSGPRLREFRRLAPEVFTAASPGVIGLATHGFGLRTLLRDPGRVLQIPIRYPGAPLPLVRPDVIRWAHHSGRLVHVWTVNDPAQMHRLIDLGVDGIVSDDLGTLKSVLVQRDLWEGDQ